MKARGGAAPTKAHVPACYDQGCALPKNLRNMIVQRAPFRPARKTNLGIINVIVRRDLLCTVRKNEPSSEGPSAGQGRRGYRRDSIRSTIMQSNPIGCPSADLKIFILLTPLKFHPANTVVEPHEHFTKRKTLDPEAFAGASGDEQLELSLRDLYFLHLVGTYQCVNTIMLRRL